MLILKASGEKEAFNSEKLKRSLRNAGAKEPIIEKIISETIKWLHPGVTTKKIYSHAFSLLKHQPDTSGLRYRLKQAILELGPSGYPFETLIGQLFEKQGYCCKVGVIVDGACITHEMDVIATRPKEKHLIECKYSKHQGKQVSVQVPLYVRSRVNDIVKKLMCVDDARHTNFKGWVVTNTRFSDDSMQFGKCSGLQLLGWDYPYGEGLKNLIEKYKIYPITILSNLTKAHKNILLEKKIVTCNQINNECLQELNLTKRRLSCLKKELNEVL